ncbi:MAG: hypothetical protein V4610_05585 [Pseudomonadota bacterium]|jgi:hypothetical protein|nr:hypothetical protein [Sphingomonas sp.]WEJ97916.1 MAG: hypothetical protein P0Y59_13170 [Sphingomonas sp.]
MREIQFTIVTATLAAALLQLLVQSPQAEPKMKMTHLCPPIAIPS